MWEPTLWDAPTDQPPPIGMLDPRSLDVRFAAWIQTLEAAEIVAEVRRLNDQIRHRGFRHYSINALAEVVRWHVHLEKGPDAAGFKINSVYLSRLARHLMDAYPAEFPPVCGCLRHEKTPLTYFELRELRS
jgi:hypothetical protein